MPERRLDIAGEPLVAHEIAQRVLKTRTVEGQAGVCTLLWTAAKLDDLDVIAPFAAIPHFQARGVLRKGHWDRLQDLFHPDARMLNILLTYPDGILGINCTRSVVGQTGLVNLNWTSNQGRRLLGTHTEKLGDLVGLALTTTFMRASPSPGVTVTSRLADLPETLDIAFDSPDAFDVTRALSRVFEWIEPTANVHVIVTGSVTRVTFAGLKMLDDCGACCDWMFGFGNPASRISDIDVARTGELVSVLATKDGKERSIRWSLFRWLHEPQERLAQNAVRLRVLSPSHYELEAAGPRQFPLAFLEQ